MSAVATPVPPQAVQTEPTPAGQPPIQPVQPRNPDGTFAPQAVQPPAPAPVPVAPPVSKPYDILTEGDKVKVKFSDLPEVYEGTQQEILSKVTEALYNTKKWAQTRQPQQVHQPVQPVPQPQSPFATPEEKAAADQLLDLTARGLGLKNGDELKERMGFITQTTEETATRDLSINFMAQNPDYNPTQENSEKLAGIISKMVPSDEAWGRMPQQQQLSIMQAAHALAIQSKVYTANAPQTAQNLTGPPPPPPIPVQNSPRETYAGVPPELIPTINDTQAVILNKIAKLKEMGLMQ